MKFVSFGGEEEEGMVDKNKNKKTQSEITRTINFICYFTCFHCSEKQAKQVRWGKKIKSESSLVGSYYKLICQEIGFICFARWKAGKDIEYNLTMYIHKKQQKNNVDNFYKLKTLMREGGDEGYTILKWIFF